MSGVESFNADYITDEHGNKKAVILSLEDYQTLLEDLDDLGVIAERRDEETVAHMQLLKELDISSYGTG